MWPICVRAIFIFIIGYLDVISAYDDPSDCSVCGYVQPELMEKIRGGEAINDTKSFPWMVSLRESPDYNLCGGAILDEYFILTAAHCVKSEDGEIYHDTKVYFQTHSERQMSSGVAIEKFMVHPKFELIESDETDVTFAKYDIALLKLKEKIKCDMYKRPVCLPSSDSVIPLGKTNTIAGWGTPYAGFRGQTEVLHYGSLKHLNFDECIKAVPETFMIRDHMLCFGETKQTVCYGDSGGPLVDKINSKYTVVGISSSETDTSCPNTKPTILTDVAKFVSWIKEQQKTALETTPWKNENGK